MRRYAVPEKRPGFIDLSDGGILFGATVHKTSFFSSTFFIDAGSLSRGPSAFPFFYQPV
jgi:hypothetical protein